MNASGWLMVLLTVLFTGLKLTGYITWSWVWVLSPLWIGLLTSFLIVVIVVICAVVFGVKRNGKRIKNK